MWRIPPVGWCATCLAARDEERPAATLWRGTSLCREHLQAVLAPDLADYRIPPASSEGSDHA